MTKEEFREWVLENDCSFEPIDGVNHTGRSVRIVNNAYSWAYYYFRLHIDESEMPDFQVCQACEKLYIPSPHGIVC